MLLMLLDSFFQVTFLDILILVFGPGIVSTLVVGFFFYFGCRNLGLVATISFNDLASIIGTKNAPFRTKCEFISIFMIQTIAPIDDLM